MTVEDFAAVPADADADEGATEIAAGTAREAAAEAAAGAVSTASHGATAEAVSGASGEVADGSESAPSIVAVSEAVEAAAAAMAKVAAGVAAKVAAATADAVAAAEAASKPSFDTFVFDLDGTLLDTLPDLTVLTNEALAQEGYPPRTQDEIHGFVGNGLMALMYQAIPEGTDAGDAERAMERWKDLFPTYGNDLTVPYPKVQEMLSELLKRGCKLGVLSNKFDAGVQQVIGQKLPGIFEVAHGECAEIPRKPDPTGLLRTIRELGSIPERTVYVGDSPGDVRTARNAGAFAVAVTWGYHDEADFSAEGADPDLMARSPLDLLALAPAPTPHSPVSAEASASADAIQVAELSVPVEASAAASPVSGVSRETFSDAAPGAEEHEDVLSEERASVSRETFAGAEEKSRA